MMARICTKRTAGEFLHNKQSIKMEIPYVTKALENVSPVPQISIWIRNNFIVTILIQLCSTEKGERESAYA